VLYQYDSCPFCNKVRAYLDFHRVPYVLVEVDPLTQSAIKWSSHKKVPLAVLNGEALGESNVIIDRVEALLGVSGAARTPEETRWRTWVDERLVRLLTVSIYRTWSESAQASDYITQRNFSLWTAIPAKWVGTALMFAIARRMRSKYAIPEDVRAALYAELDEWAAAVAGPGRPFLGGEVPGTTDLCVFGALRAVRGLDTERDMFVHSAVRPWYDRMVVAVGSSALEHRIGEAPTPPAVALA
jgi:microsomal prostaglandin-E synthase 2